MTSAAEPETDTSASLVRALPQLPPVVPVPWGVAGPNQAATISRSQAKKRVSTQSHGKRSARGDP